MGINKTIPTNFGIDAVHHVINNIEINRPASKLSFRVVGYPAASYYINNNNGLRWDELTFNFSQLPPSVLTKIQDLKEAIEIEMLNLLPAWDGGTQVQDDGEPMS